MVQEETEEGGRVDDVCKHCAEKWHKAEILSSFEGVEWNDSCSYDE